MAEENNPNLSPEINAWIKHVSENEGFAIKDRKAGEMFTATTRSGSVYTFVVINPEQSEVALVSPDNRQVSLREPKLYMVDGATAGGSMTRVGWIGIGSYLRLYPLVGGILTITPIQWLTFKQDPVKVKEITEKAEAKRPKFLTEKETEEIEKKIETDARKTFPSEQAEQVVNFLSHFCLSGKDMFMRYFLSAHRAGKLPGALKTVIKQMHEHWVYRPPEIRGMFVTEQDVYYMTMAYKDIGLELPK
ncbi:MAG: hypothetical protein AAB345_03965 [Patescibacteria group bacterium]